jgi:mercuric ion transport protein
MDDANIVASERTRQCTCGKTAGGNKRVIQWATAGGMLAALGVCAACCLLPFALLSVGVAGVWVSRLDALAPYKWSLIVLTAALLGYGFYAAYLRPKRSCAAGSACQVCGSGRSVRAGLWFATILAISGIVFEYLEPGPAGP